HISATGSTRLIPVLEVLALENESLVQRLQYLLGRPIVLVVAVALVRKRGVHRVMKIVAPHPVVSEAASLRRTHQRGIVLIRLRDDAHFAPQLLSKRMNVARDLL